MLESFIALVRLVGYCAGLVIAAAVLTVAWVAVAYVDRHAFDSDLLGYQRLRDPVSGCEWVVLSSPPYVDRNSYEILSRHEFEFLYEPAKGDAA